MDGPRNESRTTSDRRRWSSIAAILCALVLAGCQLLTVAEVDPSSAPSAAKPTDLERLLACGSWVADPSWSVLTLTARLDTPPLVKEGWRWKFVVPEPAKNSPPGAAPIPELPADIAELRGRFRGLWEPLGESHPQDPDDWARQLEELETIARKSGPTGMTATILLARCSPNDPPKWDLLFEKLPPETGSSIAAETYAAAAETLCRVSATPVGDPEENFAAAGRWLEQPGIAEPVRMELFRGIARRIPPRQIPGLADVVTQKDAAQLASPVFRAAIEGCVLHAWQRRQDGVAWNYEDDNWPGGLWSCRYSKDATLRQLLGRWAALAGHPEALGVLKSQRQDVELGVREEAVLSLGWLSGDESQKELLAAVAKGTEPERDAAIVSLARDGVEAILAYAQAESPRLRATTARELGRFPGRDSAVALASLMNDRSAKVQLAAVEACSQPGWKDAGSISLLLHALRVGTLETQMAALERLRAEWGHDPEYPLNGTDEERAAAVRKLAADHHVSAEVFTMYAATEPSEPGPVDVLSQQNEIHRLLQIYLDPANANPRELIRDDALREFDAAVVPFIEQELKGRSGPRVEAIFRDVLPKLHPGYAALAKLEVKDPVKRRRAARELRDAAASASLSPLMLQRLAQQMVTEQDRQVWQDVSAALVHDALPEAAQIALIALNSPWPDIRQFGCEYFERHPQPEYAQWVLPRLEDSDRQLRLRAIRILARCGNPTVLDSPRDQPDAPGLRKVLTESDQQLRWEAVLAMSTLGDRQAAQEIVRQSYDPHPRQREVAVAAMGQSGQSRFVEHLLRRAWTENDPSVQAAMLKALDQLTPMNDRPGLAPDSSISDKINQWAQWWEARQRKLSAASSTTATTRP